MRILASLALSAALLTAGCTDPYGNVDPGRTALLGAGIAAVAGLAIIGSQQHHDNHQYQRYNNYPRGGYGGGYGGGYRGGYGGGRPYYYGK